MRNLRLWLEMLGLCWRRRPLATTLVFAFHLFTMVAFAGAALGLKALVDASDGAPVMVVASAAIGAALALGVDRYVGEAAGIMTVHLVDRVGLTGVEPEIIRMCTTIEELDHLERPEYLDRVTAVRGQGWAIVESAWSSLQAAFVVIRLALLLLLLGGVDPWLLVLVVFAITQIWLDRRGKQRIADTHTATSEDVRLQRRLFEIVTDPSTSKEVRVTGAGAELISRQRAAWSRVIRARTRARLAAALWSVAGWTVFAIGYTVALWLMLNRGGTAGSVVLVVTAAAQLRSVVAMGLGHSAQAVESSRVIQPFLWLRDQYAAGKAGRGGPGREAPARLTEGIAIEGLTFTYPGASQPAVADLSIVLPAGSVVAVVGEYGSGKTTLVKILSKFYEPTSGSVRVDGVNLSEISSTSWWASMSAAFQDFGRYQTTAADSVGLGDLSAGRDAVHRALVAADADGFVARLPEGADTELGSRFGGIELSEGQWQRIALARAVMRTRPIMFVLDEPTASLDAPSEHAIFQRYIARSREIAVNGGITVIVSHRFSTVANADLILVMQKGRLIEAGVHADLLAHNGTYAEFYNIQASAYAA